MEWWQAAFFGLVQGATEFLPVSSSGHLRVVEHFAGLSEPQTVFDLFLHLGTLVAIVLYFRRDLQQLLVAPVKAVRRMRTAEGWRAALAEPGLRGVWLIVLGSVPTAVIGFKLGPLLEAKAASLGFVAAMFLVNSALLFASRLVTIPFVGARLNTGYFGLRWYDALFIGTVQGLAVARGVSRSGSTISAALMLGVDRETAGRYSFLLSLPAVGGASLYAALALPDAPWPPADLLVLGGSVALVSGLLALHLLMRVVKHGRFHRFGWYTLALGSGLMVWHCWSEEIISWWTAVSYGG